MASTLSILRNANRIIRDQLDAADEQVKATEMEARQTLDDCVKRRENIKRKRELIQEIERVQLESLAEIEEAESFVGEARQPAGTDSTAPALIGNRLAFAVVKASQTATYMKR
ncbi:MAG: hypothetical protein ACLPID_14095 [Beijerinckiaceae bacterium]